MNKSIFTIVIVFLFINTVAIVSLHKKQISLDFETGELLFKTNNLKILVKKNYSLLKQINESLKITPCDERIKDGIKKCYHEED